MEKTLYIENRPIYLEYDETKYDIEYFAYKIVIKRLSDNKIIGIFNDNIEYIIHCYKNGNDNFILAKGSKKSDFSAVLRHFVDEGFNNLSLKKECYCSSSSRRINRIEKNLFVVEDDRFGKRLYNLEEKSTKFKNIYKDEKIEKFLGKDVVMVEESKRPYWAHDDIHDTITYGINPETYEIVTPIWSNLQQRFIPIYTEKDIEKIKEKLKKKGINFYRRDDESLGDITIDYEIQKYLNLLSECYPRREKVYENLEETNLNVEFIKKFKKDDCLY